MLVRPLLRRGTGALTLAAAFFACEGGPIIPSSPNQTEPSAPTSSAVPTQPVSFSHLPNPVHAGDFADPFVLVSDSVYYAYATNSGSSNVPVMRSTDLVTWLPAGDAMPVLATWAVSGRKLTWAPAVASIDGQFVLFYTARDRRTNLQCIGRAESASPTGPFTDASQSPFVCQDELGGSIDASLVPNSAGQLYLLWKNDGNCCNKLVSLWSQRLSSDARQLVGEPAVLITRDEQWEGPLVEAPTMWQENGAWHLLYSANMWNTDRYAIGYAHCASPMGPCRKSGDPVMASDSMTAGPGGAEVFVDQTGQRWMAYHGWSVGRVGYRHGGVRSMRLDRVELVGAQLTADAGTPQWPVHE